MKNPFIVLVGVYAVGVLASLSVDLYHYWSAGGDGGFAFGEALAFASYWPLRAYWNLV